MEHTEARPTRGRTDRIIGWMLLSAMVLAAGSILTIVGAALTEAALRAGPSVERPAGRGTDTVQARLATAPVNALTEPVTIVTNRADRERLESVIEEAIAGQGGYILAEASPDGYRVYATTRGTAQLLSEHNAGRPLYEQRPQPEQYAGLPAAITTAKGPADTSVIVRVWAPTFEKRALLNTTLGGGFGVIGGVMMLVITMIIMASRHLPETEDRKPESGGVGDVAESS